jgi:hypothetical protein
MLTSQNILNETIKKALTDVGAPIQDVGRQIKYDTEEKCEQENGGNWGDRLAP